jgi:hypothetical protein
MTTSNLGKPLHIANNFVKQIISNSSTIPHTSDNKFHILQTMHSERDGRSLDWSGRAGAGWFGLVQVARSAQTRHAHVESNVAPDSGSAVIKML